MEPVAAGAVIVLQAVGYELVLVAAVGILLLGTEDLLFDALWFSRPAPPRRPSDRARLHGRLAVFVPAWQESAVLPCTLRAMLGQWHGDDDVRIYVGCYPNDGETLLAVGKLVASEPRLRLVVAPHDGPTSKADNLNQMWQALGEDERAEAFTFAAVILHDAEDQVSAAELDLYRQHLPGAMLVQIPVEPLLCPGTGIIAAHYADEFAEAHRKEMPLRAALGAALPAAGVGCAFSRTALTLLALGREDGPFHAESLTEDYEAGVILGASGGICRFVDAHDARGRRIATRSAFPDDLFASVRQKSRWIAGISLAGWDRLDWHGDRIDWRITAVQSGRGWLVRWMLWRDRRAILSAVVMLAAYLGLLLTVCDWIGGWTGWWQAASMGDEITLLLALNGLLLCWRLAMRALFSGLVYGWRQGLYAIPRAFVGNIIHILAARRAMAIYLRQLWTNQLVWDKTVHAPVPAAGAGQSLSTVR